DDYYKLYINGRFVCQGPAPAYHFHYNVNEYDISGFLREAENVIAVHVYYQGLINRVWNSGDLRMGMAAEITADGEILLATDSSWKYHIAEEFTGMRTTGYLTQFLEDIDNRKKITGWKETVFDDSGWGSVCVNEAADYVFYPQITPSVQVYTIPPVSINKIEKGNLLIDFGREITGRILLRASGRSGQELEIHYGEELTSPVKVRSEMRCNCDYIEKWILSGGDDLLENYDYKAFRYVQILSHGAHVKTESVIAEVRHYPFDDSFCDFKSPDPLLKQIWEICKNGIKFGTQEGYLDCPSREKGQYLGDATIVAQAHAYLTGDYRLYKKCLHDFALSAHICPGLMAVCPGNFMQEIADYSLQWPMQLLKYYELCGDIDFLREMLPVAQGLIDYFRGFARGDGLIENYSDKPIMVDWPPNLRDGYDYALMPEYQDGCNTVLNAFYIGAVNTVNKIKNILGAAHGNEIDDLKKAFINAFYDKECGLFKDSGVSAHHSLHANALPLFFGLTPDGLESIVEFIKGKRLSCGVYFSYFVLKALIKAGENRFVYELLTSNDERSWGNMIKEGATTCFESWGKDQKWNTSLCHPWASAPIVLLAEDFAGIAWDS
ncbi:MAG: family 78 glycoside hydrolase catalytic domain, partial [Oscillospiraceae bacterium]|nr:family 78 glycoside hydrolase catalytic domain [Oscillospiraceae bacterium]